MWTPCNIPPWGEGGGVGMREGSRGWYLAWEVFQEATTLASSRHRSGGWTSTCWIITVADPSVCRGVLWIYTNKGSGSLFAVAHGGSAAGLRGDLSVRILNQWLHHSCRCPRFGFPAQIYSSADSPSTRWSLFNFQSKYSFCLKNMEIHEIHYHVSRRTFLSCLCCRTYL